MERGWIKVWRCSQDSIVWKDPVLWKVWTWALFRAAIQPRTVPVTTGKGKTTVHLDRGQFIFGRKTAAGELDLPMSTIRNKLAKLKKLEKLDTKVDTHWSIVTIRNYSMYQDEVVYDEDRQVDRQRTGKGQAKDTKENYRIEELKKEPKTSSSPDEPVNGREPPGFSEFWEAYPRKTGKGAARKAWQKIRSPMSLLPQILEAIQAQQQTDQWRRDNGQYIPNPSTWLNQSRWEDEIHTTQQNLDDWRWPS